MKFSDYQIQELRKAILCEAVRHFPETDFTAALDYLRCLPDSSADEGDKYVPDKIFFVVEKDYAALIDPQVHSVLAPWKGEENNGRWCIFVLDMVKLQRLRPIEDEDKVFYFDYEGFPGEEYEGGWKDLLPGGGLCLFQEIKAEQEAEVLRN